MDSPSTNVSNLKLDWVENPREPWVEDLEELASGYPFEQRRWDYRPIEPVEACRRTWENPGPQAPDFLAAHFESRLVGWLRLRPASRTSAPLPGDAWTLDWERIQRNRNDIRARMFQAVLDRVQEGLVRLSQPAQNRTARTFLRRQPNLITGGTWTYMALPELSADPLRMDLPKGLKVVKLVDLDQAQVRTSPLELRNPDRPALPLDLDSGKPSGSADGGFPPLHHQDLFGYGLLREDTLQGVALAEVREAFRGEPPAEARLRQVEVHPDLRRKGLGTLLVNRVIQDLLERGVSYLELRVESEDEEVLSFFEALGFSAVSKRMRYYRIPPGHRESTRTEESP